NNLVSYQDKHIVYAGFVPDINPYFKGADLFINPVIEGGGIKTKLVEALGYDLTVISTRSGATGIPEDVPGKKMTVVDDGDWKEFARAIIAAEPALHTPQSFFDHFYWGRIAQKAGNAIRACQ
ncbi:MAG TPA: glycosyltransferase family 4 protein, partial [Ferruginibacter sp.]|nr:glycosyltransferase family 4 protein [Ferruginibacter sp.]